MQHDVLVADGSLFTLFFLKSRNMGRKEDEKRKLKKNAMSMSQDIGKMFKRFKETVEGE